MKGVAVPPTDRPVLLEGVTVVDCAEPDRAVVSAALLIERGVLRAVGPVDDLRSAADLSDMTRVDLEGAYVIPGLWDSHIHLGAVVPPYETEFEHESAGHHMIRCIRKAQDNLRSGITSLRSLGERFDADLLLRDAIDGGVIEGPRVFAAGDVMWTRQATGPTELRRQVRRAIQSGVDTIKLLSSGGIPWRSDTIGHTLHSQEEIAAAVAEAHGWGKPVAVHAMGDETVIAAARAGADTIEHGFVLSEAGVEAMAEADTTYCPNLTVTQAWNPDDLAAHGYPDWFCRNAAEARQSHHAMFRAAISRGVTVIAGVDDLPEGDAPVGIEMYDGVIGLIAELQLMHALGLTNGQALLTATKNAAAAVRRADTLGTLEPGKAADLVVLAANPLDDLAALTTVQGVWKAGREIRLTPALEPGWSGGGIR